MGHIENKVMIQCNISDVFDITNDIARWKDLFSEYAESKVLKKENNKITFQLTTVPDEENKVYSWISERTLDKKNYKCVAKRLDPLFPFEYMDIYWEYHEVLGGTEMVWIQDFKLDDKMPVSDEVFTNNLDSGSKEQMKIIKDKIENGFR